MCDKHMLLIVVRLLSHRRSQLPPPFKRPRHLAAPVVAAQLGVVEEVPHEPDLGNTEAVNDHEFSVETRVERLKVRSC